MEKVSKSKKSEWFGMKVTPEEKRKIKELAKRRKMSQSELIIDLVNKESLNENSDQQKQSLLDIVGELAGIYEAPPDLSTNKKYMEGYGE